VKQNKYCLEVLKAKWSVPDIEKQERSFLDMRRMRELLEPKNGQEISEGPSLLKIIVSKMFAEQESACASDNIWGYFSGFASNEVS
jgi:hypothetical protein